jgi:3-hydroxybutyrate dehydrogenase
VASIEDFPVERWDAIIAINLSSAFHTTRLALPAMRRQLGPHHQHRLGARPGGLGPQVAYVAAKHGIVGLTKVTALENATTGVTCNAICPGWVLTPLVQKQVDARAAAGSATSAEATRELLGEKGALAAVHHARAAGELAVFCAAMRPPTCAAWAWGVDGGWTAQ